MIGERERERETRRFNWLDGWMNGWDEMRWNGMEWYSGGGLPVWLVHSFVFIGVSMNHFGGILISVQYFCLILYVISPFLPLYLFISFMCFGFCMKI